MMRKLLPLVVIVLMSTRAIAQDEDLLRYVRFDIGNLQYGAVLDEDSQSGYLCEGEIDSRVTIASDWTFEKTSDTLSVGATRHPQYAQQYIMLDDGFDDIFSRSIDYVGSRQSLTGRSIWGHSLIACNGQFVLSDGKRLPITVPGGMKPVIFREEGMGSRNHFDFYYTYRGQRIRRQGHIQSQRPSYIGYELGTFYENTGFYYFLVPSSATDIGMSYRPNGRQDNSVWLQMNPDQRVVNVSKEYAAIRRYFGSELYMGINNTRQFAPNSRYDFQYNIDFRPVVRKFFEDFNRYKFGNVRALTYNPDRHYDQVDIIMHWFSDVNQRTGISAAAATCVDGDGVTIWINKWRWGYLNVETRIAVLYHELAHALLDVGHVPDEARHESEIMHPTGFSWINKSFGDFESSIFRMSGNFVDAGHPSSGDCQNIFTR